MGEVIDEEVGQRQAEMKSSLDGSRLVRCGGNLVSPCSFQDCAGGEYMRFMLKAIMDTEKANAVSRAGALGKTIQSIVAELKPEAAYFTDDHGKRTAYVFFEMRDASQIPAIAEPWFLALNAHIEFHAVMVADDLAKAGPSIEQAAKKYAA
jgi:hypothetical protein